MYTCRFLGLRKARRSQALEAQLAESDAETQRLRIAFEELKKTTSATISTTEKKLSEIEKEADTRVGICNDEKMLY
jgi:hypothetical protein